MSDVTWAQPLLGDVAEVIDPHPSHRAPPEVEGGVPFVGIGDLTTRGEVLVSSARKVSPRVLDEHKTRYSVASGDIAYGRVATVGKVMRFGEITELFALSPTMALIKPSAVSPSYLAHFLQSRRWDEESVKLLTGTTRSSLGIQLLRKIRISCPRTLEEQSSIGEVLDTLDTAIHETEAIIAKLKAVKQGLLHDLLTRGIDANGELRPPQAEAPDLYKPSPLGWVPTQWEIETVAKACSYVVDCPHSTPHFQDQGVLVARTMHIKDGMFLDALASRVSERQYCERVARLEPQAGDVIFTREAPVGEAFVIPAGMKICLGQRVMLLRPKDGRLVADYLLAQIYSGTVKDRIATLTSGTTNPHLNVSEVKDFEVPLPPFVEQQGIAERLSGLESRLQSEMREQLKLELLKAGLMDDLLSGRVRVTPVMAEIEREKECA